MTHRLLGRPRLPGRPGQKAGWLAGFAVVLVLGGCSAVTGNDAAPVVAVPPAAGATQSAGLVGRPEPVGSSATTVPARPTVEIPTAWDSEIEAMFGRYWLYWEAFAAAHAPPNADPSFAPLQQLSTDENWRSLQDQLRGFAADGLVLVLPDRSVTEHLIRLPNATVVAGEEGEDVVIQDCWIDDFVQQSVTGQIVDQTAEAKLMNVTMTMTDGQWRVAGVTRAAPDTDGYDQCIALSP